VAGFSLGTRHGSVFLPGGLDMTRMAGLAIDHLRETPAIDQARFKLGLPEMPAAAAEFRYSQDGYDLHLKTVEHREMLFLGDTYESFVQGLSFNARRNIRKCRRRVEALGLRFRFSMADDALDVRRLADLARNNIEGRRTLDHYRKYLGYRSERGQAFRAALYAADGQIISVAGGVVGGASATMFLQNNHGAWRDISPSLTLRALLIEALIEHRVKTLLFMDGCGGTLNSACRPSLTGTLVVTRAAPLPRLRRAAIAGTVRLARDLRRGAGRRKRLMASPRLGPRPCRPA